MRLFKLFGHYYALMLNFALLCAMENSAQGIQIGDKLPDIEIKRIINYHTNQARISDFKGKALLIDFWFSTCTACLESMPKLDSLQKEFGSDLQILLVNHEPEEKARSTFKKIRRLDNIQLASVVSDTLLGLLFPHRSAPHEIWINKEGKVKAITDHVSVTRQNLADLIVGKELNLPLKRDNMEFSVTKPLINSTSNEYILQYSCITTYQPGLSGSLGIYFDNENNKLRARAKNTDLKSLYRLAYGQWGKDFHIQRIIFEFKDSLQYMPNANNSHLFCFDHIWKDTSWSKALKDMQYQLDAFFKISSIIEVRKVPCLVLKKSSGSSKAISTIKSNRGEMFTDKGNLIVENVKLKNLIENRINYGLYPWSPYQVIDVTGISERVSLLLPEKYESLEQVNKYLKEYDLILYLEERTLPVIVLKNQSKG